MKFEISTPLLQAVCNKLVKAVSTKDIIPSLKHFLFDVTDKNIHIIAGDSATYLEKDIPCNTIKEAGKVSIDGKEFTKLINKINSDTVILETSTDNRVAIKAGKSKWNLATIDPEEYIYPEDLQCDVSDIKLTLPELKKALKLGAITVSKNATEVYFTGYKLGQGIMTTNRNNLSIYEMNICSDNLLLTQDLASLINDLDGDTVTIGYTSDFMEIKTEGTRVIGNLLCGLENFPDYDILEQFSYDKMGVVAKKDLIPVLDRAMIFVEALGAVELVFKPSSVIECKLVGNTSVDTYEEIPYAGSIDVSIKVNVGMLSQIANSLDSDTLELYVADSESPLLIKSGAYKCLMASMSVE